jgi:hypothetical protein
MVSRFYSLAAPNESVLSRILPRFKGSLQFLTFRINLLRIDVTGRLNGYES